MCRIGAWLAGLYEYQPRHEDLCTHTTMSVPFDGLRDVDRSEADGDKSMRIDLIRLGTWLDRNIETTAAEEHKIARREQDRDPVERNCTKLTCQ